MYSLRKGSRVRSRVKKRVRQLLFIMMCRLLQAADKPKHGVYGLQDLAGEEFQETIAERILAIFIDFPFNLKDLLNEGKSSRFSGSADNEWRKKNGQRSQTMLVARTLALNR